MRRILLYTSVMGALSLVDQPAFSQQNVQPPLIQPDNQAELLRARAGGLQAANDWYRAHSGYIRTLGQNANEGVLAYGQLMVNVGQYYKLLAEAQLILAQTRLTMAQARREELNNELLYEQVLIFKQRADQYREDIRRVRNEAARFRRDANLAIEVRFGNTTPQNLNSFRRVLRKIDITAVNDALWKDSEAFPADSFESLTRTRPRVPPFEGGNGYELMEFLKMFRLKVRLGSSAHRYIADIFLAIDGAITERRQNLELKTDEMLANFLATIDQLGVPTDRIGG